MVRVILPWARYHNLDQHARAIIFPTREQVRMYEDESYLNQIVEVEDAWAVQAAFNDLCVAAWTPNQSIEDREANAVIIEAANSVLNSVPLAQA